jgi:hypothetical protein
MVDCKWIIPEEVSEEGYYWFGDSSELSLCEVGRMYGDKTMYVFWINSEERERLSDISGRFMGPIYPPEHWVPEYKSDMAS